MKNVTFTTYIKRHVRVKLVKNNLYLRTVHEHTEQTNDNIRMVKASSVMLDETRDTEG